METENERLQTIFDDAIELNCSKNFFGTITKDKWLIFGVKLRITPPHKITEGFFDIQFHFRFRKIISRTKIGIKNSLCNFEGKSMRWLHAKN